MQLFINNWSAALTAPATVSAVQLSIDPAQAAKLVGLGSGDYYLLTLALVDAGGVETEWEIVKVTAVSSGEITVVRGQEASAARGWAAGSIASARATAGSLDGLRGEVGPAGPVGPKGDTGLAGPKGDTGLTGATGSKGDQGDAGAAGVDGADGAGLNIIGELPSYGDLPVSGSAGGGYIIAGDLWLWAGTEWLNAGPIRGPKGDTGDTGLKGDQGDIGPKGDTGLKGDTGPAGEDGGVGGVSYSIFDSGKPGGTLQSQKKEYFNLVGSATTDIINIASGAGYLSSLFLAFFGADTSWAGSIINVYYDGEITPSISMPFERFFIAQYAGINSAMISDFFGFNRASADTIGMFCNFPIPYSNGIKITLTNSTATTYRVFSTAVNHSGVSNTWSRTRKLMAKDTYIASAAANSVNTFLDVSSGVPGRLAGIWFLEDDFPGSLLPKGAALEGNFKIYMDGAATPSYESSGTEDYFLMSFYFGGAGVNRNGGEVGTTYLSATAGTFGAWRTHVRNPYTFESGIKVTWQCGETGNLAFTGTARVWATVFYYTE